MDPINFRPDEPAVRDFPETPASTLSIHNSLLISGGPSQPSASLSVTRAADGASIYYKNDNIGLVWVEARTIADGSLRTIQAQGQTVGTGQIYPTINTYFMDFSEGGNKYLRISFSGSWGQRAVALGIASLANGVITQSVTLTISTTTLSTSGSATVQVVTNAEGQGQQTVTKLVTLTAASYADILAIIPGGPIQDRFAGQLPKASYFLNFFESVYALNQQSASMRLSQHGIGTDRVGIAQYLTYSSHKMDPLSPSAPGNNINDIKANAQAANYWFQAMAWFAAGCFAAANPLLGAAAGAAAAYMSAQFNDYVNENLQNLESNPDSSTGSGDTSGGGTGGGDVGGGGGGGGGGDLGGDVHEQED
jgi:uncharacterized membrane protein YgcG